MSWWTFSGQKAINADPQVGTMTKPNKEMAAKLAADLVNSTQHHEDIDPVTWDALLRFGHEGVTAHVTVGSISELLRQSQKRNAA